MTSFTPRFRVTHAITADLTRTERARGLFAEAGAAPTDPTRHYRLTAGLVRSVAEL